MVHNAREGARWHANYARTIRVAHAAYSGRAEHGSSVVDALANLGFPVLVGILAIADHADVPGILDDCDKPGGAGDEHVREDDVHEGGDDAESDVFKKKCEMFEEELKQLTIQLNKAEEQIKEERWKT